MEYIYDRQEMNEKVFDFIYGSAMRDAIQQKAFIGEKRWVGKIENPKIILSGYIGKVLKNEFTSRREHDEFFLKTANSICEEINSQKPQGIETDIFSFGNAQKLINITVKHTYALCCQTYSLREGFRFCHCPVDVKMLNVVWDKCKGKFDLGKQQDFCKPWGSEGITGNSQPELDELPARYALFQKSVRDIIGHGDIFPIEFDYIEWKP